MPFTCDGATIARDGAIVRGLSDAERKGSDMGGGRVKWAGCVVYSAWCVVRQAHHEGSGLVAMLIAKVARIVLLAILDFPHGEPVEPRMIVLQRSSPLPRPLSRLAAERWERRAVPGTRVLGILVCNACDPGTTRPDVFEDFVQCATIEPNLPDRTGFPPCEAEAPILSRLAKVSGSIPAGKDTRRISADGRTWISSIQMTFHPPSGLPPISPQGGRSHWHQRHCHYFQC